MQTLESLQIEYESLMSERLNILNRVDKLTESGAPKKDFASCGELLMTNINFIRGIRYDMKVLKKQGHRLVKSKLKEEKRIMSLQPKTKEAFLALKSKGLKDKDIKQAWGMHNSAFYKMKAKFGLVKPNKKNVEKETVKPGNVKRKNFDVKGDFSKKVATKIVDTIIEEKASKGVVEVKEVEAVPVEIQLADTPSNPNTDMLAIIAEVKETVKALRTENEQLRAELWTDRIRRLYKLQEKLDTLIMETQGVTLTDHADEQLLALIVELAEAMNEEASFKYWKINKNVDRNLLAFELADVLHFILSRGLMFGLEKDIEVEVSKRDTVTKQFLALLSSATVLESTDPEVVKVYHKQLFNLFIGLTEMLQFKWADIEEAYIEKNAINTQRQLTKY